MQADENEHRVISHFRILGPIARGGMGAVYRAEDLTLRRHVALKLLPPERTTDGESRRRFLREARSAAAVSHPAIATIHEVGEDEHGTVYIAMELVEGRTLRAVLADGPPPLGEALRIAHDVARGLARAHAAGIVHRDVKPENVMLDDEGSVTILDFGLAKLRAAEARDAPASEGETPEPVTTGVRVVGTPEYMSPEQARGAPVGPASDVFALGVLLYELVAGARPFTGGSSLEVIASILRDEAPRLAGVDAALGDLVARCLRHDASARPADAGVVAAELAVLRGVGTPAATRPSKDDGEVALLTTISSQEPLRAPPPRRRWPLVVVGVLAAAIAGGALHLATRDAPAAAPAPPPAPPAGPIEPALESVIDADPSLTHAAVSHDGRTLAIATLDGLVLRELATGEERRVTLPGAGRVGSVAWIRGRDELLAMAVPSSGESWVWRVRARGGDPARLFQALTAAATPDGDIAYFTIGRTPCEVRVRTASGEDRSVRRGGCGTGGLEWTSDHRRLAYVEAGEGEDALPQVVLLDLDGSTTVLHRSPRLVLETAHSPVAVLPDGCVAFFLAAAAPASGCSLHRVCPDAGERAEPELLARFPSFSAAALSLDAEGRAYVVGVSSQADVAIAELDEEGGPGEPSVVTDTLAEDREPAWLDDRTLVFHSNRGGRYGVFRAELADGSQRRITPPEAHATYPVPGPDGLLYWRTRETDEGGTSVTTLRRVDLDGSHDVDAHAPFDTLFFAAAMPSPRTLRVSCAAGACLLGEQIGREYRIAPLGDTADPSSAIVVRGDTFTHALSPDGAEVAVAQDGALVAVGRDGRAQRTLLSAPGLGFVYVAWHPNGRWLYATSVGGSPLFELHRVAADGSDHAVFYGSDTRWVGSPSVSPDGARLALSLKRYDRSLYSFAFDSARPPHQ